MFSISVIDFSVVVALLPAYNARNEQLSKMSISVAKRLKVTGPGFRFLKSGREIRTKSLLDCFWMRRRKITQPLR